MAHEIDGSRAVYGMNRPAWHRIGDVLEGCFTAKEGLDRIYYKVDKAPLVAKVQMPDGTVQEVSVDSHDITFRINPDTGNVDLFAPVSKDYTVLDMYEKFAFVDEVVSQVDGAYYEAMFALRGGRQTVGMVNMGAVALDPEGVNDIQARYLGAFNSYDASWALRLKFGNMRADCANMSAVFLGQRTSGDISIRHTTNMEARINEARKTLGLFRDYMEMFTVDAEAMCKTDLDDNTFQRIVEGLFTSTDGGVVEKDTEAIANVRITYELNPAEANIYGTVWGGFNAVTYHADHAVAARGGKRTTAEEQKFLRQIGDTGGDLKQRAWDAFKEVVEERPKVVAVP